MKINIRALIKEDIEKLDDAATEDKEITKFLPPLWRGLDETGDEDTQHFVIENEDKEIMSYGRLSKSDSDYILGTAVFKKYRRKGLGTTIKKYLIKKAIERGATKIFSITKKTNIAIIALNKKLGFKEVKEDGDNLIFRLKVLTPITIKFKNLK